MTSERSTEANTSSLLNRNGILQHMKEGSIVIDPFKPENLRTVSYDVTLGPNFFRSQIHNSHFLYNPFDEETVRKYWGKPKKAERAYKVFEMERRIPSNVNPNDLVIVFAPGELILGHTKEFIGGRIKATTMMKARSSIGRSGFTVCKCAGWGDLGYINRWTMEIKNELQTYNFLIVGRSVAQLAFFEVDPLDDDYSEDSGKYQTSTDLATLKRTWTPDAMLPKLWLDR